MARRGSGGSSFDSVNRWAAQERKRQEKRDRASDRAERQRRGDGPSVGKFVKTGITVAVGIGGILAEPPSTEILEPGDAYERSRSSLVDNRDEYLDEQTRAANERKSGSSEEL